MKLMGDYKRTYRMHKLLQFTLGNKVWYFYQKRNDLGAYLFKLFGIKFVWLDYLVRTFNAASHIEIYDAANNIVKIDGSYMFFYSKDNAHYRNYYFTK